MNDLNKFYVWQPERGPPTFLHETYADAEREAKRLAAANPGKRFFVLHAVAVVQVRDPIEVTRLASLHDDIPL